jgi:hypothetical protein
MVGDCTLAGVLGTGERFGETRSSTVSPEQARHALAGGTAIMGEPRLFRRCGP